MRNGPEHIFSIMAILLCGNLLQAGTATLSGTIYQEEAVAVRFDPLFLGEHITELNSEGVDDKFSFTLEVGNGGLVELVCLGGAIELYLEPGDDLKVLLEEGDDGPTMSFEGTGAANNDLWRDFRNNYRNDEILEKYGAQLDISGVDVWEFWLYDQRKSAWDFYKQHPSKGMISQSFKDLIEAEIKYDYHANILAYSVEKAKTSANNFNKFADATLSLETKYTVSSGVVPEEAMNFVIAKFIYENCDKIDSPIARKYVLQLSKSSTPAYGKILQEECGEWLTKPDPAKEAALAEKASRGKKAKSQPFVLNNLEGEKVYLGDYEGKVIYVDFWASWCGPCRQQFPFAKKMKEELSKKEKEQVVFLYISIDNNEAAWKKGIERAGVDGVHLFSPGGWGASVCNYFSIQSIPRYVIIDKKGEIVNANAPRPQDPLALEEIRKLMKRKK